MKADWLCKLGGQPCGPFTVDQLRQLAAAGKIDATTEVRREKDPRWFLAGRVVGLLPDKTTAAREDAPAVGPSKAVRPSLPSAGPATARAAPPRPAAQRGGSAIPTGKPVLAGPAAALPVGRPVTGTTSSTATTVPAVATPNLTFIAVSTTGFGASKSDARKAEPRQKSNNSVILVAALGGLCVLILVVGGTLAALSLGSSETATSPANQSAQLAESNSGSSPEGTSSVESEANPASPRDRVAEGEGEESAAPVAPSLVARSPSADSETAQLVKQITSWNKLSKSRTQLGLKNIARFEVNSMWLASDATGRPVAAKPAATNGASQTVAGGSASSSSSQPAEVPKFIFAELTISNTGDRPVQYLGWNSPSESAAILVDGTGQVLVPVAPAETPKVARLSATVIAPGGTVTDTFVFQAPPGTVDTLRLALPKVALSSAAKGFFAIEIPPAMLSVRTTENSGRSPNPSLAGPGEASARDEFAELQRQLMESEDSTATKPVSSTGDDTAPPAVGAEPQGDASGTPAEPKKPPTAAEFDKFLREMDEKEATDNPDASPTPDAAPASK